MFRVGKILHPTDFSPLSKLALDAAGQLAADYRVPLVLLHVREPAVSYGELVPVEPPNIHELLLRDLRDLETPSGVAVEHRLETGPIADTIVRVARETGCELIVISTHGRGGLSRALLGSVTEAVLRRADCMVLSVKAPGR
jgi:nucleotide-binding universal stress UspA family protein